MRHLAIDLDDDTAFCLRLYATANRLDQDAAAARLLRDVLPLLLGCGIEDEGGDDHLRVTLQYGHAFQCLQVVLP